MALFNGQNVYKGNRLFRAAIMNSGSILPADPVNSTKAQAAFDRVSSISGCSAFGPVPANLLACLRQLPACDQAGCAGGYQYAANSLAIANTGFAYLPRPDGFVLPDSPSALAARGNFANIPFSEQPLFPFSQPCLTVTSSSNTPKSSATREMKAPFSRRGQISIRLTTWSICYPPTTIPALAGVS